jgi:hypothetical protein
VKATFELMNIAPIDSLIDFGKFIFKEKYTINNENNRLHPNFKIERATKLVQTGAKKLFEVLREK